MSGWLGFRKGLANLQVAIHNVSDSKISTRMKRKGKLICNAGAQWLGMLAPSSLLFTWGRRLSKAYLVKWLSSSSAGMGQDSNGSRTPHSTYCRADTFDSSTQQPWYISPGLQFWEEASPPQHGPGSSRLTQPRARQLQNSASILVSICTPQPVLERVPARYSHEQGGLPRCSTPPQQ